MPDRKTCDVVMQGGITSGVVYPAAVLKLQETYDFVNVGGASAGAIAAAATAAAQLGRSRLDEGGGGGFDRLAALSAQLSKDGFLPSLFQPTPKTRPLLELLLAALRGAHAGKGVLGLLRAIVGVTLAAGRFLTAGIITGAAAGGLLYLLIVWLVGGDAGGRGLVLAGLLAGLGALLGALGQAIIAAMEAVPGNGYGIATGMGAPGARTPALTEWFNYQLDRLAGLRPGEAPLTFGALEAGGVTLRMVTTSLSEQRPFRLPFQEHRFVFEAAEMRRYFPEEVVAHMVQHAHVSERLTLPEGFHFLPDAADLPVIVAVRMSLSFPVLVSAVPLWTIGSPRAPVAGKRAVPREELLQNWFSDGGICSNFPIHFFDSWVPTRPTFGISLVEVPGGTFTNTTGPYEEADDPQRVPRNGIEPVHLPLPNRPEPASWAKVGGLISFLGKVVGTALNYRDTLQRQLPSYRERVVQIRLASDEGGLNLDMPSARVQMLVARGAQAGEKLASFDFDQHRWVRTRVLIGLLTEQIALLAERRAQGLLDVSALAAVLPPDKVPYRRDAAWCDSATGFLEALAAAHHHLGTMTARDPVPKPRPILRVTPPV